MTIDKEFWIVLTRIDAPDGGRSDPPACWRNVAGSTEKDHALAIARGAIARGEAAIVARVDLWEFPDAPAADGAPGTRARAVVVQ